MKTKHIIKSVSCATAVVALLSVNARAAGVMLRNFTLVEKLASADGNIVIGEFTGNGSNTGQVGYEIDVANGVSVNAFMVSHSNPLPVSVPDDWLAITVAKAGWATGNYGFGRVTGASLGSFESLFGAVDTHVTVFTAPNVSVISPGFVDDSNDVEEVGWSSFSFTPRFIRDGSASTEFIAIDANGAIIGQSIPEPSGVLLGGLGMLAVLRRRR